MQTLPGTTIEVDNEGFLLNPEDWDMELAYELAKIENIELSEHHLQVVKFIRDYYETNQSVPEARICLRELGKQLGEDVVNRRFLYRLFPYGYGQQACKIAGMRKPLKLMLDV